MRAIFLFLLLIILCHHLSAQEDTLAQKFKTWTFTFENGEAKKFVYLHNDPTLLPKYSFGVSPAGYTNTGEGSLTFQLLGEARITDWWMLNLRYTRPHVDYVDGGQENFTSNLMATQDFHVLNHFKIVSITRSHVRRIPIEYAKGGEADTLYKAQMPHDIKHSLDIDVGYNYLAVPNPILYGDDAIGNFTRNYTEYYLANSQFHNVLFGFSYSRDQSYKFTADDQSYSFMRHMRIYANVSYTIEGESDFIRKEVSIVPVPTAQETVIDKPKEANFSLNKFGWRVGWKQDLYFKNSPFGLYLGAEFGQRPHYKSLDTELGEEFSDYDLTFMAHIGLRFGKI